MKRALIFVIVLAGLAAGGWAFNTRFQITPRATTTAANIAAAKQRWICRMDPQIIQDHPGLCPVCGMPLTPQDQAPASGELIRPATAPAKREILYYWDPMLGPSSISNKPGISSMGMDLVPVFKGDVSEGSTVVIDPAVVQNMGVRTALVTRGSLTRTVRVAGMLDVPDTGQFDVNLRVNGWIEKLYANQEGMHVHKGEPLFDIYSPDLQLAEEELIGATAAVKSATANGPATEAQSLVDSARRKLHLLGVADQDIDVIAQATSIPKTIPFRSPTDGAIEDKMVVEGSAVQSGMKMMRIEDHSTLWLNAQVYEQQMALVKVGQQAEATFDGVPGKVFTGSVDFIHPHLDHETRTAVVRIALDNQGQDLKPGMYASVKILTTAAADALLVPREAVIDTGTRQIIFVMPSQGHFEPRDVQMGMVGDDDRVQILGGVKEGEIVITSGQFLMDVASRTNEAIAKLRGGSTGN